MATLNTTYPTMLDVAKRSDPDGKIARIVEILNLTNEMLDDIPWIECNNTASHRTTVRTGIPQATWRRLYEGVQPVKSTTAQVTENTGMLENYSQVDAALIELAQDKAGFRLSEEKPILEGMNQQVQTTILYGNEGTNPAAFTGLAPRYNTRSAAVAQSADNVLHGGGSSTTNTSVWLIGWGPETVHGLYPKGTAAGLQQKDLGESTVQNSDGSLYQAMRSHFKWMPGLSVRDWRYVVRIANIDVTTLVKDAATGSDLVDLMTQALELIPSLGGCRPVFYCNRTVRSFLRRQIRNSKNVFLSMEEVAGKKVMVFDQVPVKRVDALLSTEAVVPNS